MEPDFSYPMEWSAEILTHATSAERMMMRKKKSKVDFRPPGLPGHPGLPDFSGCPGCPGCLRCPGCPGYPLCPGCPGCPGCPRCPEFLITNAIDPSEPDDERPLEPEPEPDSMTDRHRRRMVKITKRLKMWHSRHSEKRVNLGKNKHSTGKSGKT